VIPCRTSLRYDRIEDIVLVGPEVIQEMEEKMKTIRERLKEVHDRHKSYVDAHRIDRSYEVRDIVFLQNHKRVQSNLGKERKFH
jgi:hypothetical protein